MMINMKYQGPERRANQEVAFGQLQSDVSVIMNEMKNHDKASYEFRVGIKEDIKKILEAVFGNGKPGHNQRLKTLEDRCDRGKALWTVTISIVVGIVIIVGGGYFKQRLNL